MDKPRFGWVFPVFVFAIAAMAFAPNQLTFASIHLGWCVTGALLVLGLIATAAFVRSPLFLLVVLLSVAVLASPYGLPGEVGLPFLGIGCLFATQGRWPVSIWWTRVVALIAIIWLLWVLHQWYFYDIVPREERWGFIRFFSPEWPGEAEWGRVSRPMGNANPMAGLLVMIVPLGVALTVYESKARFWRTLWTVGSAVAAGVLVATGSRAGLVAPVLATAAYVALLPGSRLRARTKGLLFGAGSLLFLGLVSSSSVYRERLLNPQSQAYSDEVRGDFLETGALMVRANPWTGVGAGGVPARYSDYLSADADQPGCYQLHCTPLQWTVEFGLLGGLLWVALAAWTLHALHSAARATESRALRSGAAVAATAYLLLSLLDYQLYLPVTAFCWGTCLGLATRRGPRFEIPMRVRLPAASCTLFFAAMALALVVRGESPRRHSSDAARALAVGNPKDALDALGRAMEAAPESPVYPAIAATIVTTLPASDAEAAATNRHMADVLMLKARHNAPSFAYLTSLHGWIWVDADPGKAEALFLDALHRSPKLPDAWQGLARACARQGRLDDAVSALAMNGLIVPEDLFSPQIRSGFFKGASRRVSSRFRELTLDYAQKFSSDRRGIDRLNKVVRQVDAWAAAEERVDRLVQQEPNWSSAPLWRHLSSINFNKTSAGEYALRSRCMVTALVYSVLGLDIKDGQAVSILDSATGRALNAEARPILTSRESFPAFGHYFGDATLSLVPLRVAEVDLLAQLYVYESTPVRPHLCARYFVVK